MFRYGGNQTKLSQMSPALTAALYLSSLVTSDQDLLTTDILPLLHLLRNHHLQSPLLLK